MNLLSYLKDEFFALLLHFICMLLLSAFLSLTGYPASGIGLILTVWLLVLGGWHLVRWLGRRSYFREIDHLLSELDQRYLLGELLPRSWRLEDRLYRNILRKSNKAVIERIHSIEDHEREYREYIESWVHEIKTPITSISLICENNRRQPSESSREAFRTIESENQKIENYVDMALYYARSEDVYKDYMIQMTDTNTLVCDVLAKNRSCLISNGIQIEVDCPDQIYTDGKWISFILNQFILNSVKYKSAQPVFHIYTRKTPKGVLLIFEDNGIGIREEELPRIFEKGFTGTNGRTHERATGMGLYLCRKLCRKLGVALHAESVWGTGTKMILDFPVSTYLSKL